MNEDTKIVPYMEQKNINTAFAKAQAELQNPKKNQKGYGYQYAGLDQITSHVNEVLGKYDLIVQQLLQDQEREGNWVCIETVIKHSSGEQMQASFFALPVEPGKGMSLAQSYGATITYARRYALAAYVNIAAEEDIDGAIHRDPPKAKPKPKPKVSKSALISNVKAKLIDHGATAYAKAKGFDPDTATVQQLETFLAKTSEDITKKVNDWEAEQAGGKAAA